MNKKCSILIDKINAFIAQTNVKEVDAVKFSNLFKFDLAVTITLNSKLYSNRTETTSCIHSKLLTNLNLSLSDPLNSKKPAKLMVREY